jgi:intein/homing endonuclease
MGKKVQSKYARTYSSFSGTDIVASITPPGGRPIVFGELQTVSYSIHREKFPVRTLGSINPKGFCLTEDNYVMTRDRGYISVKDIHSGDYVETLPGKWGLVTESYVQPEKDCYTISTERKYILSGSYDHPILTEDGWKSLGNILPGDKIAIGSRTVCSADDYPISDDLLKLIAYLIGDGALHIYNKPNGSVEYRISLCIADSEINTIGAETESILNKLKIPFRDSRSREDKCISRYISVCKDGFAKTDWHKRQYNELHDVILSLGLYNTYSHTKFIPQQLICGMSKRQISLFLSRLYSTDGCYFIDGEYTRVSYCTTSDKLAIEVRVLLNILGIQSSMQFRELSGTKSSTGIAYRNNCHVITIKDAISLLRFINLVNIYGKENKINNKIHDIEKQMGYENIGIPMKEFRSIVTDVLIKKNNGQKSGIGLKKFLNKYNLYNPKLTVTFKKALSVAEELNDPEFSVMIQDRIFNVVMSDRNYEYMLVTSNEYIGNKVVYNLTVAGTSTFIANHIVVHNTYGGRTIAGSLIFTVFDRHIIKEAVKQMFNPKSDDSLYDLYDLSTMEYNDMKQRMVIDEMPPFDITITFANEYGQRSTMSILGVTIVDEGQVMSIEDMMTENTMSYMAMDIELMKNI